MNIHKSQLFWCELQGYKVLTHCHMGIQVSIESVFAIEWGAKELLRVAQPHESYNIKKLGFVPFIAGNIAFLF